MLEYENASLISEKYLKVIRYHSFYPWHSYGEYKEFMNDKDYIVLKDVLEFNSFDLYSKTDNILISNKTKEYYDKLLDEYFIGDIEW